MKELVIPVGLIGTLIGALMGLGVWKEKLEAGEKRQDALEQRVTKGEQRWISVDKRLCAMAVHMKLEKGNCE